MKLLSQRPLPPNLLDTAPAEPPISTEIAVSGTGQCPPSCKRFLTVVTYALTCLGEMLQGFFNAKPCLGRAMPLAVAGNPVLHRAASCCLQVNIS